MTRTLRPADILPQPAICRGTVLLSSAYAGGNAINVTNQSSSSTTITFASDGTLNTAALDSHIGVNFGRVTRLWGQVNSAHADSASLSEAPKIFSMAIGGHRWLLYEGGGRSDLVAPPPEINGLNSAASIASFGVTAKDYCYMAVLQVSTAAHVNQSSGLDKGTLLNLKNGGTEILRIQSDGRGDDVTGARWMVSDGGAFTFKPAEIAVETTPVVLTVISSSRGIEIYQNEEIFATASRSAVVGTAADSYLGKLSGSVAGGTSGVFEGRIAAEMLWPSLSSRDAASRRAMLYELFGIDHRRSRPKSKTLIFVGDSNMAGYQCVGRNGWATQMQPSFAGVRFHNFGVEGSTITNNPSGVFAWANTIGLMDHCVSRAVARAQGDVGLVIASVINDWLISPQPTPTDLFNGYMTVATKARAANPNVKVFICTSYAYLTPHQSLQNSENTLIRNGAAANNYTTIDFNSNSTLSAITDRHLVDSEHGIAASLATPVIKAKMGWT